MKNNILIILSYALVLAMLSFIACQPDPITPDNCEGSNLLPDFSVFNNNCKAPCEVEMSNASRNATSYQWDFGDGNTSIDGFPAHIYTRPGSYNVTLIASSGDCKDTLVQPVSINWQTYESTYGTGRTGGYGVVQTEEGDYVVAGESYDGNTYDMYLTKVSPSGILLWEQKFGGSKSEYPSAIKQTPDGGFIIIGETNSKGAGKSDIYLVKTAENGSVEWERTYGGSEFDEGYGVDLTADGGYILTGATDSKGAGEEDMWLIKVNQIGDLMWDQTFGGSAYDRGSSVVESPDGGFVVLGVTESKGAGGLDFYLLKTSATGQLLWEETYGGVNYERARSIQATSDGSFILLGDTESQGSGEYDVYLIKVSSSGSKIWEKTYGGTNNDFGVELKETLDGGFILAGETQSFGVGERAYLIKTTKDGTREWERTFGKTSANYGADVLQSADGGYLMVGSSLSNGSFSKILLVKTDQQGNVN